MRVASGRKRAADTAEAQFIVANAMPGHDAGVPRKPRLEDSLLLPGKVGA